MKNENIMIKIDEKNFPDVNFRNWLLKQDYATDGVLTEEILSEITEMDIRRCGIHSLKGIEHFTALTKLNCSINRLTSLDVSHCPALKVLNCFINHLAYLDLSHNPALTILDCYHYNQKCEAATDTLIANLPQTDGGIIYIGEGYSREKIKAAGEKGWVMQEGPQAVMSFYTYKNARC